MSDRDVVINFLKYKDKNVIEDDIDKILELYLVIDEN